MSTLLLKNIHTLVTVTTVIRFFTVSTYTVRTA